VVGGRDYRACPVAAQCFPGKAAIIYCKTNKKRWKDRVNRRKELREKCRKEMKGRDGQSIYCSYLYTFYREFMRLLIDL